MRTENYLMSIKDLQSLLGSLTTNIKDYPQAKDYISTFMEIDFPTITLDDEVKTALEKMHKNNIEIMPVIDKEGKYWGAINQNLCKREIIEAHLNGVSELFITDILDKIDLTIPTLSTESSLEAAINIFENSDSIYIAIVDANFKYIGILSRTKIVRFLMLQNRLMN